MHTEEIVADVYTTLEYISWILKKLVLILLKIRQVFYDCTYLEEDATDLEDRVMDLGEDHVDLGASIFRVLYMLRKVHASPCGDSEIHAVCLQRNTRIEEV